MQARRYLKVQLAGNEEGPGPTISFAPAMEGRAEGESSVPKSGIAPQMPHAKSWSPGDGACVDALASTKSVAESEPDYRVDEPGETSMSLRRFHSRLPQRTRYALRGVAQAVRHQSLRAWRLVGAPGDTSLHVDTMHRYDTQHGLNVYTSCPAGQSTSRRTRCSI